MALYTERVMQHTAQGNWETHVPAGKRYVLRCMTVSNVSTVEGRVVLYGGLVYLYNVVVPVWGGSKPIDMRCTLYAGERLALSIWDADISVHITAYVFADSSRDETSIGERLDQLPGAPWPPLQPAPL